MRNRRTRAAGKKRRWLATLVLLAGVALLGVWVWSQVRGAVYQDWGNWAFDRTAHGQPATVREYLAEKAGHVKSAVRDKLGIQREEKLGEPSAASAPTPGKRPPQLQEGELLGRLSVPRLRLKAIVREGAGKDTLDVALGHISGTAMPGQRGNVGVAGHRDTLFRGLSGIRKNDVIEFQTLAGTYQYQVANTEIVTPRSTNVLLPGKSPEMTLVTCYPFHYIGPAPDRFIVKARLVSSTPVTTGSIAAPPTRQDRKRPADPHRIEFQVVERHSRQVAPGVSIGLSSVDPETQRITGWMWIMPDRRTIWLRNQSVREPIVFYGETDGRARKLVITRVTRGSITGYYVVSGPPDAGLSASN
jgi:sortase A